jgi:hypothetical protein
VLKHCAANRKRWLSALPNIGPYIYDVKISGFTRSSIYIYMKLGKGLNTPTMLNLVDTLGLLSQKIPQ